METDLANLLRPPREPVLLPDPWWWLPWAGWITIAVLSLLLVFLWWRRQPRRLPPPPPPVVLARQRLGRIDPAAPAETVAQVTVAALRQYCAARFGLPVTGRTSEELLAQLRDRPTLPEAAASSLGAFLEVRDVVAFAGPAAAADSGPALLERAEAFLTAAETPLPAPVANTGGPVTQGHSD